MLWDENHYDTSPFWVHSALFGIIEKVLPFAWFYINFIYVWFICFFNHQSFITKWTVHSGEQTYPTGDICDAMGELHEHVPASGKRQDLRFLDWPHGHPNKSLGLIYLVFCWDDTCPYGLLIPICKSYSANWNNPNPRGFWSCHQPGVRLFQMSFHVTFVRFFFPELSWPFRKVQLELFVRIFGGPRKKYQEMVVK